MGIRSAIYQSAYQLAYEVYIYIYMYDMGHRVWEVLDDNHAN